MIFYNLPLWAKLVIAIVVDILDFLALLPVFETGVDLGATAIAYALVGPIGMLAIWEILDPIGRVDGLIPSVTIVVLLNAGLTGEWA